MDTNCPIAAVARRMSRSLKQTLALGPSAHFTGAFSHQAGKIQPDGSGIYGIDLQRLC